MFQTQRGGIQALDAKDSACVLPSDVSLIVFILLAFREQNNGNFIVFQSIISKKRFIHTVSRQVYHRKAAFLKVVEYAIALYGTPICGDKLPQLPLCIDIRVDIAARHSQEVRHGNAAKAGYRSSPLIHSPYSLLRNAQTDCHRVSFRPLASFRQIHIIYIYTKVHRTHHREELWSLKITKTPLLSCAIPLRSPLSKEKKRAVRSLRMLKPSAVSYVKAVSSSHILRLSAIFVY